MKIFHCSALGHRLYLWGFIQLLLCLACLPAAFGLVPGPIFLSESLADYYQAYPAAPLEQPKVRGELRCLKLDGQAFCVGDSWQKAQAQKQLLRAERQTRLVVFPDRSESVSSSAQVRGLLALAPLEIAWQSQQQARILGLKSLPLLSSVLSSQEPSKDLLLAELLGSTLPAALAEVPVRYAEAQGLAYLWVRDSKGQARVIGVLLL